MASQELNVFSEQDVTQAESEVIYNFSDGSLLDDVKMARSKAIENSRRLSVLQGDFTAFRGTVENWMLSMSNKLEQIHQTIAGGSEAQDENSQSLLAPVVTRGPSSVRKGTPFLIITFPDGKTEELRIPISSEQHILSSTSHRESVRKLLLFFHDIKFLRSCTRTGTQKPAKSRPGTSSAAREQSVKSKDSLPIRTRCAAIALYKKINPVEEVLAGIPHLAAKEEVKKEQEAGDIITAILNYYHCKYGDDGKIKVKVGAATAAAEPRNEEMETD